MKEESKPHVVKLTNPYKKSQLNYFGKTGQLSDDDGYLHWTFEATPEAEAILDSFDKPTPINLRVYIDHLRRTQDEIKRAQLRRREKNDQYEFSSTRI